MVHDARHSVSWPVARVGKRARGRERERGRAGEHWAAAVCVYVQYLSPAAAPNKTLPRERGARTCLILCLSCWPYRCEGVKLEQWETCGLSFPFFYLNLKVFYFLYTVRASGVVFLNLFLFSRVEVPVSLYTVEFWIFLNITSRISDKASAGVLGCFRWYFCDPGYRLTFLL